MTMGKNTSTLTTNKTLIALAISLGVAGGTLMFLSGNAVDEVKIFRYFQVYHDIRTPITSQVSLSVPMSIPYLNSSAYLNDTIHYQISRANFGFNGISRGITNFEDFSMACVLISRNNGLSINNCIPNQTGTGRACFTRTFPRNFLQRIFGPKAVVYYATIDMEFPGPAVTLAQSKFKYKDEWRRYYNDTKYEEIEQQQYDYDVNTVAIIEGFIKFQMP